MFAALAIAPVILAALLSTVAPLKEARAMRAAGIGTPPWVPFAMMTGLGLSSLIFGLFNPELMTAIFGQG